MRLRLFGSLSSRRWLRFEPTRPGGTAQLYMSGAGGVYSNLESYWPGRAISRSAQQPLDWIKVEGAAFASGHDQACCSLALGCDRLAHGSGGWSLEPRAWRRAQALCCPFVDIDDPSQDYDWTPYFVSGMSRQSSQLTRHFAFFGRGELGLGRITWLRRHQTRLLAPCSKNAAYCSPMVQREPTCLHGVGKR